MNSIRRSAGERIFEVFNIILMVVIALIMIYPLLYVIFSSFSDPYALAAHSGLLLKPQGFSIEAYRMMSKNSMILTGYANTLFVVVVGTTLNIVLTALGAYFLSTKGPMFKKPITIMIIVTMYFSGGMIPLYFTVTGLGLEDNLLALILPSAINTFNLIVMKTAFQAVPESMKESAYLDLPGRLRRSGLGRSPVRLRPRGKRPGLHRFSSEPRRTGIYPADLPAPPGFGRPFAGGGGGGF